jgi:hypothetical protein
MQLDTPLSRFQTSLPTSLQTTDNLSNLLTTSIIVPCSALNQPPPCAACKRHGDEALARSSTTLIPFLKNRKPTSDDDLQHRFPKTVGKVICSTLDTSTRRGGAAGLYGTDFWQQDPLQDYHFSEERRARKTHLSAQAPSIQTNEARPTHNCDHLSAHNSVQLAKSIHPPLPTVRTQATRDPVLPPLIIRLPGIDSEKKAPAAQDPILQL